ncbi:MAG: class I SAM-dependent methyltransferase [Leptolyngbya sp. SIO3F4]|nr:class I SAM-dependent methyltransferase [Leptolyngbya sp. SIO3F4]
MKCRICENSINNKEYEVREMLLGTRDLFKYFQCSQCNCLQIESFPKNIGKYYSKEYYSYKRIDQASLLKRTIRNLRHDYILFQKNLIGKFILSKKVKNYALESLALLPSLNKKTRILDVGCGSGELLYFLQELGFSHLLGIDPFNEENIKYGNGLIIQKESLKNIQDKWDLIMFHHSFEHLSNPFEVLLKTFYLLEKPGFCIIRIPTVSSLAWKQYNVDWVQLDAPRHFFLHSVKSIELLANKSGFKVLNIVYDSTSFQFWGSEQYKNDIPLNDERSLNKNPEKSLFSKQEINDFEKKSEELNRKKYGDQVVLLLGK